MARLHLTFVAVLFVLALQRVDGRNNGVGRLPMLGWSSWCTSGTCYQVNEKNNTQFHDYCDEEMVKSVATEMLSNGMHAAGYTHIHLDDCWGAMTRDDSNTITWDTDRFPSGLPALISWLHERGFLFGLYTSVGNETCSTGGRANKTIQRGIPGSCPSNRTIVDNQAYTAAHCQKTYGLDAAAFAKWKVDFVKLDWCTGHKQTLLPNIGLPTNNTLMRELTGAFAKALNDTKRAMWLNFHCLGTYQDWCATDGNTWRIGKDHHDNWESTSHTIDVLKGVCAH
jgi:alpha-galactosidase